MNRNLILIAVVALGVLAYMFGRPAEVPPASPAGDTAAVRARPTDVPAERSAPDTRAGQLPPLNRELVVMTDSDMQGLAESRRHLINRPDPF